MKKIFMLIVFLFFTALSLSGGGGTRPEPNSAGCENNGFEMRLYSDRAVYKTTDAIKVWATLQYVGDGDTVTIWHGEPYMVFSITDGKNFNSGGSILTVLTSTVLKQGKLYRFDYQKSGGWDAGGPDAAFWENFYREKELRLPAGEYTISVDGWFSLTDAVIGSESGLRCELKILVEP